MNCIIFCDYIPDDGFLKPSVLNKVGAKYIKPLKPLSCCDPCKAIASDTPLKFFGSVNNNLRALSGPISLAIFTLSSTLAVKTYNIYICLVQM